MDKIFEYGHKKMRNGITICHFTLNRFYAEGLKATKLREPKRKIISDYLKKDGVKDVYRQGRFLYAELENGTRLDITNH